MRESVLPAFQMTAVISTLARKQGFSVQTWELFTYLPSCYLTVSLISHPIDVPFRSPDSPLFLHGFKTFGGVKSPVEALVNAMLGDRYKLIFNKA